MRYLIFTLLASLLLACETADIVSIPQDYHDSSFDYDSSTEYYDDRGELSEKGTNRGSFDMSMGEDVATLTIYPRMGWSYELTFDNIVNHTLSDGSEVTSFRIVRSAQYLSNAISNDDNEFRVDGTTRIELEDNASVIGTYDGLIYDDGSMQFEFESINLKSGEYVITTINGYPIDL